jgi:hypothetical protein
MRSILNFNDPKIILEEQSNYEELGRKNFDF